MYGGPRDGGLRRETGLPLAPGRCRWATWSTTQADSAGVQGIGYDYVLGSGGVYVQSRSAHLVARVPVAPCTVRGLAPVAENLQLTHGPIPAQLFELGLGWFQDAPDTERLFAVRWDGRAYRLVVPPQAGTATRLAYQPPTVTTQVASTTLVSVTVVEARQSVEVCPAGMRHAAFSGSARQ